MAESPATDGGAPPRPTPPPIPRQTSQGTVPIISKTQADTKVFANHAHLNKLASLFGPGGPGGAGGFPMGGPPGMRPKLPGAPAPAMPVEEKEVKLEHMTAGRAKVAGRKKRAPAKKGFNAAAPSGAGGDADGDDGDAPSGEEKRPTSNRISVSTVSPAAAAQNQKTLQQQQQQQPQQPQKVAPLIDPSLSASPSMESIATAASNAAADDPFAVEDDEEDDPIILPALTPENVTDVLKDLHLRIELLEQTQKELKTENRILRDELGKLNAQAQAMAQDALNEHEMGDVERERRVNVELQRVYKAGWVQKEGTSVKGWKRRFFVLYETQIDFYENPRTDTKPAGTITLEGGDISPIKVRVNVTKPCMELTVGKNKFHFFADTAQENSAWFSAISNRIITVSYVKKVRSMGQRTNEALLNFLNSFNPDVGNVPRPLRLHKTPLSMDVVNIVARILSDPARPCTPISQLELSKASIKDAEIQVLADALKMNMTANALNFYGNDITVEGLKALIPVLTSKLCPIDTLILDDTKIGDEGAKLLADMLTKSRIKYLSLANANLTAEAAASFAAVLTSKEAQPNNFTHLNISGNNIGDNGADALASIVEYSTTLLRLDISNCQLTDVGAAKIADAIRSKTTRVVELHMDGNNLSKDGETNIIHVGQVDSSLESLSAAKFALGKNELLVMHLLNTYGFAN